MPQMYPQRGKNRDSSELSCHKVKGKGETNFFGLLYFLSAFSFYSYFSSFRGLIYDASNTDNTNGLHLKRRIDLLSG